MQLTEHYWLANPNNIAQFDHHKALTEFFPPDVLKWQGNLPDEDFQCENVEGDEARAVKGDASKGCLLYTSIHDHKQHLYHCGSQNQGCYRCLFSVFTGKEFRKTAVKCRSKSAVRSYDGIGEHGACNGNDDTDIDPVSYTHLGMIS